MKKILPLILLGLIFLPVIGIAEEIAPPDVDPLSAIDQITNLAFGVLLTLAVVFILLAAFYFVTAAGDDAKIVKAKNMLLYAVIGVVVAILARGVVNYLQGFFKEV